MQLGPDHKAKMDILFMSCFKTRWKGLTFFIGLSVFKGEFEELWLHEKQ